MNTAGRKRRRDASTGSNGWIPTKRNVTNLSYLLSTNIPANLKVCRLLERQNGQFTRDSFDHGLSSLLLLSCEVGNVEVFEDLFNLSLPLFSIDHVYTYHVTCFPLSLYSGRATHKEITIVQNLDLNTCRTNTLLHIAAENGNLDIVKFLVQRGATVDTLNCCSRTPLMMGIMSDEVTKYLVDFGANVNHRDKDGYSALMLAVMYGADFSTFKLLLDAGAQRCVSDVYGNSLLSLIKRSCTILFLKELFSRGVHPDSDIHGQLQLAGCPLPLNRPFCIAYESLFSTYNLCVSRMHRLSMKYHYLLYYSLPEPFRQNFAELLEEKAVIGLHFEHPAPIAAYGNRKEVQTPEELSQLMLSPNRSEELTYQWLLIAERLSGNTAGDLFSCYSDLFDLTQIGELSVCLRFSEIILNQLKQTPFSVSATRLIELVLLSFSSVMTKIGEEKLNPSQDEIKLLNLILSNVSQAVEQYKITRSLQHIHGNQVTGLVLTISNNFLFWNEWLEDLIEVFTSIHNFGSAFIELKVTENLFHAFKYMPTLGCFHTEDNTTILIESLLFGHKFSFISFLFQIGAEELVNVPSPWEYPIHIAVENNDHQIVSLLLEHGAHPDVVDSKGLDPIHSTDDSHMINLLLQHYPLPLCCLAASTIVNSKIPYKEMDLPRHIKKFINLHYWKEM